MTSYTVENKANGPRGFYGSNGLVMLEPGASAEGVEVSDAEVASAKAVGLSFNAGEGGGDDKPALTGKNKAELLAIAKDEGVVIEDGSTNPDIVSAIELHREASA